MKRVLTIVLAFTMLMFCACEPVEVRVVTDEIETTTEPELESSCETTEEITNEEVTTEDETTTEEYCCATLEDVFNKEKFVDCLVTTTYSEDYSPVYLGGERTDCVTLIFKCNAPVLGMDGESARLLIYHSSKFDTTIRKQAYSSTISYNCDVLLYESVIFYKDSQKILYSALDYHCDYLMVYSFSYTEWAGDMEVLKNYGYCPYILVPQYTVHNEYGELVTVTKEADAIILDSEEK